MSQADYTIADQDGASYLVDINAQLAAIVSNNSGATEPSTTYSFQWWADTSGGFLKLRNAANSDWITVGILASANLGLLPLTGGTLTGPLTINNALLLTNAPPMGYGSGSGATVNQSTSKTTAVTINKPAGQITTNNAALAAGAKIAFTVNNSLISAPDLLILTKNGSAFFGTYSVYAETYSGGATVYLTNISAGSLSDAVVLNFLVIKGSTV